MRFWGPIMTAINTRSLISVSGCSNILAHPSSRSFHRSLRSMYSRRMNLLPNSFPVGSSDSRRSFPRSSGILTTAFYNKPLSTLGRMVRFVCHHEHKWEGS